MATKNKSNGDLYHELRRLWKLAFPLKSKGASDAEMLEWWKSNSSNRDVIKNKISSFNLKIVARPNPIAHCFSKAADTQIQKSLPVNEPAPEIESVPSPEEDDESEVISQPRKAPQQEKIKQEISDTEKGLNTLLQARDAGLALSINQLSNLKTLKKDLIDKKKKLKRLQSQQKSSKKGRERKKRIVLQIQQKYPEASKEIGELVPQPVGRPRLERDQPDLLDAIVNIVTSHSSADERRRTETLRTVKTLNNLLTELRILGYNISRSGLYIRLLPDNCRTLEGKRHVKTVPVKLVRAQNTGRKFHPDTHFATATIKYLKELAVLFGSQSVSIISQDDKAKIPLGLPAAKKQGPILMKLDYRVQLPDHDFVIAAGHKLIPSVYAGLEILKDAVSYSGPTYIALRSGKHDSSTAARHADDLYRLLKLPEFQIIVRTNTKNLGNESEPNHEPVPSSSASQNTTNNIFKPIQILLVDGGPDEGPRYPKTLKFAAINFVRCNFDAMFVATHAPGQSASNPVERRMAPLSRDLCGLILPHDGFGKHLNAQGKTIDEELEKKNFQKAGEMLAEVWSERIIDSFPVLAEFVLPGENKRSTLISVSSANDGTDSTGDSGVYQNSVTYSDKSSETENFQFFTEIWKSRHVRQSQYLLQIVKCEDTRCCRPTRTNIREFLRDQFLPAPVKVIKSASGLQLGKFDSMDGHFMNLTTRLSLDFLLDYPLKCFDKFCPSAQDKIMDTEFRCGTCRDYFVTKSALKTHKQIHNAVDQIFENDEEEEIPQLVEDGIFMIDDMQTWLSPLFVEESEPVP